MTEWLVIGIGSSGAMELPQSNDQRYQQQACAPRWRPTNFQAYGQQWTMSSPVGLGLGPPMRVGGVVTEGDQPPKFMLDESMLTELMDLDPLSDQLGDGWGMGGNNQGGDYGIMPCLNYFNSSPSPIIASGLSPMYSNGNSNIINTSIASNHQQQQHEYLPQHHHDASDANSHSSPVSLSFAQRAAATSACESAGSVGSLTHMLLSDNNFGAEDTSSKDHASLNSSSLRSCSYVRNASGVQGSQGGKNSSPSSQCGNQREEEKSHGEVKDSGRVKVHTDDQMGNRKSRGILRGPGPPLLLRDRMTQALRFIGRLRVDMLAQVWMPVTKGNKTYLTSKEQPYVLEHKNDQLWLYRSISESFEFPIEKEPGNVLGLPGRVFQNQIPEWTPNVQFYTSQEYSRVKEAQRCDVRGSIGVPVFDPLTRKCLAVIELVGRAEKVQYGPDLEIIHRALQVILSTSPLMIGY